MAADYSNLGLDPMFYPVATNPPEQQSLTSTDLESMIQDGDLLNNMLSTVSADKITAGTIAAGQTVNVGGNNIVISASDPSITVSDPSTGYTVIYIGKKTGFF